MINGEKNTSAQISKVTSSYIDVSKFEELELLVAKLKDSTLATQFNEKVYDKDEDGNIIESTERLVFNSADMIMCLGLGAELGMSPWEALSYGKSLNLTSIKKIRKGEKMGLDFATSLEQIYVWGSGGKEIIYTSIHVVSTVLTKIGVLQEVIQNGKTPIYKCIDANTDKEINFDASKHYPIPRIDNPDVLKEVIDGVLEKRMTPVYKSAKPVYIGEVRLTRYNKILKQNEVISIPYSSQEAIDAGLLKGINSDGESVKGKDNWNAHPSVHLLKMSKMIGARMIASDALQGIYVGDEINQIKSTADIDNTIEDAEIIE